MESGSDEPVIRDVTVEGFAVVTLASGTLEASFSPALGMLGCSLQHAGEELLELRGGLRGYAETGSTRAIPLLHPWANRLSALEYRAAGRTVHIDPASPLVRHDANGLPIHGLLNACPYWKTVERGVDANGAYLTAGLDTTAVSGFLSAFPFPHDLGITVRLNRDRLSVTTRVTPSGDVAVPISFGYHPCFRLPGLPRAQWWADLPVRSRLVLDERMIPTGTREPCSIPKGPLGDCSLDATFGDLPQPSRFELRGGGRRLVVEFVEGYPFTQIFAPPGKEFICIEPMTAPTNALVDGRDLPVIEPGQSFSATFAIAVSSER